MAHFLSVCQSLLMPFVAIVGMSAMVFASPAIALIEYDQQNEHPQLTPEGLKLFAVYFGAS